MSSLRLALKLSLQESSNHSQASSSNYRSANPTSEDHDHDVETAVKVSPASSAAPSAASSPSREKRQHQASHHHQEDPRTSTVDSPSPTRPASRVFSDPTAASTTALEGDANVRSTFSCRSSTAVRSRDASLSSSSSSTSIPSSGSSSEPTATTTAFVEPIEPVVFEPYVAPTYNPNTTVEEHLDRLRDEFRDLMHDSMGDQRLAFVPAPESVTSLLAEAWNKATGAVRGRASASSRSNINVPATAVIDRIDGKLQPVQSYFPNLLTYILASPGFPTSASGAPDSIIFAGIQPQERLQRAQDDLTALLHLTLCEMRHADYTQRLHYYMSFMKTKQAALQDAHVDFKWRVVDPFQQQQEKQSLGNHDEGVAESVGNGGSNRRCRSRLASSRTNSTRCRKRVCRLPYKKRVPFIALFPLTKAGMTLEIWKARGVDHRPIPATTDDNNSGSAANRISDLGRLVHLPFGTMVVMRGDVLHAGGFMNSQTSGDPRVHLYIYRDDGELHELDNKNSYDLPLTSHVEWAVNQPLDGADALAQAATIMVDPKSRHRKKSIVPFCRLYRHHPQRLALCG